MDQSFNAGELMNNTKNVYLQKTSYKINMHTVEQEQIQS